MKPRGFTLVEVLIYVALAAGTLVALFLVYTASLETNAYIEAQRLLLDTERPIELQIRSRLQEAPSVTQPATGSSTSLVIESETAADNPATFSLSNGQLWMQLGTQAPVALTPTTITVTDFSATRSSGTPPAILVELTLETQTTRALIARTFSFFVTLRYD